MAEPPQGSMKYYQESSIMECRVCSHPASRIILRSENRHGRHLQGPEEFNCFECDHCGCALTSVEIDENYYEKYYGSQYYSANSESPLLNRLFAILRDAGFRSRVRLLKRFAPNTARILEVGCGRGEFLNFLPPNYERVGTDIHQETGMDCEAPFSGISIWNVRLDDPSFDCGTIDKKFDAIFLWHVLEHVERPRVLFEKLSGLLHANGVILLEVPNRDGFGFLLTRRFWFHLDTPRHLIHLNKRSVEFLADHAGLKMIHFGSNPIDYFQDLAASIWSMLKTPNALMNILVLLIFMPAALLLRLFTAMWIPAKAELNTYVLKKK